MPNDQIVVTQDGRVLVGTQEARDQGLRELTGGAVWTSAAVNAQEQATLANAIAQSQQPSAADLVAAVGLGLTSWWGLGGPTWAGIASVAVNEIGVPIARMQYPPSAFGARLDWWGLYGTTPLVIYRGAKDIGASPLLAAGVALPVLATQALLRGTTWGFIAMASRSLLTVAVLLRNWHASR
jgi:hypothetical protein